MRKLLPLLAMILSGILLSACQRAVFADARPFALYYMGISNIHPGETATTAPSWLGEAPHDFSITLIRLGNNIYYQPKIDGPLSETSTFHIDPDSGTVKIQNTNGMKAGTYRVDVRCTSGGVVYDLPEAITIIMLKES